MSNIKKRQLDVLTLSGSPMFDSIGKINVSHIFMILSDIRHLCADELDLHKY